MKKILFNVYTYVFRVREYDKAMSYKLKYFSMPNLYRFAHKVIKNGRHLTNFTPYVSACIPGLDLSIPHIVKF